MPGRLTAQARILRVHTVFERIALRSPSCLDAGMGQVSYVLSFPLRDVDFEVLLPQFGQFT